MSNLVAMPRQAFSLLISRSTVFLFLWRQASQLMGRPPLEPFFLPCRMKRTPPGPEVPRTDGTIVRSSPSVVVVQIDRGE